MLPFYSSPFETSTRTQQMLFYVWMVTFGFPLGLIRIVLFCFVLPWIPSYIQPYAYIITNGSYVKQPNVRLTSPKNILLCNHHVTFDIRVIASVLASRYQLILAPKIYNMKLLYFFRSACIPFESFESFQSSINQLDQFTVSVVPSGMTVAPTFAGQMYYKWFFSGDHDTYVVDINTWNPFSYTFRTKKMSKNRLLHILDWFIYFSMPIMIYKGNIKKIDTKEPWTQERVDREIGIDFFEQECNKTYAIGWTPKKKRAWYNDTLISELDP